MHTSGHIRKHLMHMCTWYQIKWFDIAEIILNGRKYK